MKKFYCLFISIFLSICCFAQNRFTVYSVIEYETIEKEKLHNIVETPEEMRAAIDFESMDVGLFGKENRIYLCAESHEPQTDIDSTGESSISWIAKTDKPDDDTFYLLLLTSNCSGQNTTLTINPLDNSTILFTTYHLKKDKDTTKNVVYKTAISRADSLNINSKQREDTSTNIKTTNNSPIIPGIFFSIVAILLLYLAFRPNRKGHNNEKQSPDNDDNLTVNVSKPCKTTKPSPASSGIPDIKFRGVEVENFSMYMVGFSTYIAGINFRCNARDAGGFLGYAVPEPDNEYDTNAVAIYRNDGKLLGYIPKKDNREFKEWSDSCTVPCVGYILSEDGTMKGRVKALLPENENAVNKAVAYYVRWLVQERGRRFIPKGFNLKDRDKLKTDEDLIGAINDYIGEL